ncbi:hypothetical protein GE21DRAFT_3733 [Neurospora crassa]|uniref:Uncharacterized protein n=2 Tax=Neurospora crassa TaxID=5141 RepID=Q7SC16_NEUCR|nr:hypothetical protein NCU09464 [Neurospora crassa OR74A]EAA33983.1 hypothetical protein NCU09464 [Neurospora crassa OR74A]KHE83364.1 hypothetical protein GE21DRAFT_3733 [Neurospora crassa]CAE75712.1 hypothetical protein [Neurospora crassa]|eukprot:XP_963219.1 hypothetical protein NCU09464 [Neurospora crassa OR74A]
MRSSTLLAVLGTASLAAAQTTITSIYVSTPTSTSLTPPRQNERLQSCLAACMIQFPALPRVTGGGGVIPPAPAAKGCRGRTDRLDRVARDVGPCHPHQPPSPLLPVTFPPFPPPKAPIPIQTPRPVPVNSLSPDPDSAGFVPGNEDENEQTYEDPPPLPDDPPVASLPPLGF